MSVRVAGGVLSGRTGGGTSVPPTLITTLNLEEFQSGFGAWQTPGNLAPEDAWTQVVGATPSPSSGPIGGANPTTRAAEPANGYVFTEASDDQAGPWSLQSPVFNASFGPLVLTFDFHFRGDIFQGSVITDGTVIVQGWDGSAWSDIDQSIIGPKQATDSEAWRPSSEFGTYTSAGFTNPDFRFRFLADRGVGRFVSYDFSLDNVQVVGPIAAAPALLGFGTGLRRLHVSQTGDDPIDGQVPDLKFDTIQAALSAMKPGDVVTIADGRYFEELSITNFPGTAALPVWIVAENRGAVTVSNLIKEALEASVVWRSEGAGIFSIAAAEAPYVAWFDDDVMLPRWTLQDLGAPSFTVSANASQAAATFLKPDRGIAFSNGRIFLKLPDGADPSGRSISITNKFNSRQLLGTAAKHVIVDGLIFEGGGDGQAVFFDEGSTNFAIRNCVFIGSQHGVRCGADNSYVEWCEFIGAPGHTAFAQDLLDLNGAEDTTAPPNAPDGAGVFFRISGEDGVDEYEALNLVLNFPDPEQAHNRVNVSSSPLPFAGSRSMQTELRVDDPQASIDSAESGKKRAEIHNRPFRYDGGKVGWLGGAFYLPSDPMETINGCDIWQLHFYPDQGVMLHITLIDGQMILQCDGPGVKTVLPGGVIDLAADGFLDQWVRMRVQFKSTDQSDGFIKVWFKDDPEGSPRVDFSGPTKPLNSGILGPFVKWGVYHYRAKIQPDTGALALHDNITLGDETSTFDAVDPALFIRGD